MHANNAGFLCQIKCNLLYHRSVDASGQQFAFHEHMRQLASNNDDDSKLYIINLIIIINK